MNRDASPSKTSGDPDIELVPIFSSASHPEMEIVTDIFEAEDIAYMVKKRQMSGFWTTIGEHDQIRVYVEPTRIDDARALIQQAIVDEAIPGQGNFIDEPTRQELKKARQEAKKKKK